MKNLKIDKINDFIIIASLTIIGGALLSGPISTAMVMIFRPQPKWQDSLVFIENYHWIQTVPFLLGFVLMFGSCLFVAAAARLAGEESQKIMAILAMISIGVYSSLISLNYVIQAAYVPMLVKSGQQLAGLLTMTNPNSLCWAIEMFGYLFQGLAFWLLSPLFYQGRYFKAVKLLFIINLLLSIGGAVAACIDVAWAMKPFGLLMFILWNFVLAALMVLVVMNRRNITKAD